MIFLDSRPAVQIPAFDVRRGMLLVYFDDDDTRHYKQVIRAMSVLAANDIRCWQVHLKDCDSNESTRVIFSKTNHVDKVVIPNVKNDRYVFVRLAGHALYCTAKETMMLREIQPILEYQGVDLTL